MKVLVLGVLAVLILVLTMFAALLMRIRSIERMVEEMPWEIVSISEEPDAGEGRHEKPPDRTKTKAPADDYRTPMARIAADRLARRRNEVSG